MFKNAHSLSKKLLHLRTLKKGPAFLLGRIPFSDHPAKDVVSHGVQRCIEDHCGQFRINIGCDVTLLFADFHEPLIKGQGGLANLEVKTL